MERIPVDTKISRRSPALIISNAELEALGNNFVAWKRIHPEKQVTFEAYVWLMHNTYPSEAALEQGR
jgi:hypothetical protein